MVYRILLLLVAISISLRVSNSHAQTTIAQASHSSVELIEPRSQTGIIKGIVQDAVSGETLIGVNLFLQGSQIGAASDFEGSFSIQGVPTGKHVLEARMIGFEPELLPVIIKERGETVTVKLALKEETVPLSEIVVTPGRFSVNSMEAHSPQTFSQEEIKNVPQFGEDIYRAVTRLPGVTASDFSSKFMVRGGEHDEVLVTLDGLELYDPFHMKDIGGGGLSIIDAGSIGGVDLLTGAFPATYGNRLSGVFDITTATPNPGEFSSSVGISFINTRATTQGALKNGKTSWMAVGRRGYLDILLGMIDESFSFVPQYHDLLGKVQHQFDQKHTVSLQWLSSGDKLTYQEILDPNDRAISKYGNSYVWANWRSIWSNRLFSTTVLSNGSIWRDREGVNIRNDQMIRFLADDQRSFNVTNFKQNWTFDAAPNYMLFWGINLKQYAADYTYDNTRINQVVPDPVNDPTYVHTFYDEVSWDDKLSGFMASAYTRHRFRLGSRFTTELGTRFGMASWTKDRFIEPRVNAAYQLGNSTALRAGWGHFHQVQGIEQLDVQDGDFNFYKAQRAEHMVLGLEHLFESGISFRLDLYNKALSNIRPRFISLSGDATRFFPEIDPDRTQIQPESGRSRGIEVLLRRDNRKLNWWTSYSFANAEEKINGRYIPKTFDQRHTFHIDLHYRPSKNLRINMAWQYHSGWRYSDVDFDVFQVRSRDTIVETNYGDYNGQQFPAYHRMDLRISYDFSMKKHVLATYLEVRNVYNRQNVRMFSYEPTTTASGVSFQQEEEYWLPILPAIGIRMDINH